MNLEYNFFWNEKYIDERFFVRASAATTSTNGNILEGRIKPIFCSLTFEKEIQQKNELILLV